MKATLVLLAALIALTASAHDFWIEPTRFSPADGQRVGIRLRVGEYGAGEPQMRDRTHIARFVALRGSRRIPIEGAEGRDPAGWFRVSGHERTIVVYESLTRVSEMEPAAFARYVEEDGLANRTSPAKSTVRDTYSRSAKAYLAGADRAAPRPAEPVGLPLEIVPLSDIYADGPLRVQVLFDGKPLSGTLVIALREGAESRGRTGADGIVTLDVRGRGAWLVKTVHIVRTGEAAYRSWWSSMTFER